MAFEIPRRDYAPLVLLLTLDARQLARLVESIERAPTFQTLRQLSEHIGPALGLSTSNAASSLVRLLVSLYITKSHDHESQTGDFFSDLRAAMRATGQKKLEPTSEEAWDRVVDALRRLLESKALGVTAKAIDVLTEHEHVYSSARVLTEYRPIFNDPAKAPISGAIIHSLKLEYVEGGERRECFIALDTADLEDLRNVLTRAETKASSLTEFLVAKGVPVIDFLQKKTS